MRLMDREMEFDSFGYRGPSYKVPDRQEFFDKDLRSKFPTDDKGNVETVSYSSSYSNINGVQSGKKIESKKIIRDGHIVEENVTEHLLSNGDKDVLRTISNDGRTRTEQYHIDKRDNAPRLHY